MREKLKLKSCPVVFTESGQKIGKAISIIIDTETQEILQYETDPDGIKNIFEKNLLISKNQIISITKEKITVYDSTAKEAEKEQEKESQKQNAESAIATESQ